MPSVFCLHSVDVSHPALRALQQMDAQQEIHFSGEVCKQCTIVVPSLQTKNVAAAAARDERLVLVRGAFCTCPPEPTQDYHDGDGDERADITAAEKIESSKNPRPRTWPLAFM